MIEQFILMADEETLARIPGYEGRFEHYKRFVSAIWGREQGVYKFKWNPNAEEILRRFLEHSVLAIAGHASASKTFPLAAIGISEFLLDPENTKVLVTSITKSAASGKIWGVISSCWQEAARLFGGEESLPGRLMSNGVIRYQYGGITSQLMGLELVPGEQAQAADAAEKIQGYKAPNLIMIGDEWATLGRAVHETAMSNLRSNPRAKVVAAFNPDSYYDPGGMIACPIDGWSSITVDDVGWPTKVGGYCIHFDGEKSPNVVAGQELYPGLLTKEALEDIAAKNGKNSKKYFQMGRGFWSPTGSIEAIYSEEAITSHRADEGVYNWLERPERLLALDPAFATGGDRAVAVYGLCGDVRIGDSGTLRVFERKDTIELFDDATSKIDRSERVVADFKKLVHKYEVLGKNVALDSSGGGAPFASLLAREIGNDFLRVSFKEKASDLRWSRNETTVGHEKFDSLCAEIWYVGKELIRTGQLKGLDPDTILEMVARTYTEKPGGKIQIEPKAKMKLRTNGKSPDRSDALFICLHLARIRHGLASTEKAAKTREAKKSAPDIFSQTYDLASLEKPKKRRIEVPDFDPYFASIGGGGWGDSF